MIYLLRASIHESVEECPYKTGFTKRWVRTRISELQTGCPYALELVGCITGNKNQERAIHKQFEESKIRFGKTEWFKYNPRLLEIFKKS